MSKKKYKRLNLNKNWRCLKGAKFDRILNKKYFKAGEVLKKGNKYFYINSNGLKSIPKYTANRKIFADIMKNSNVSIIFFIVILI